MSVTKEPSETVSAQIHQILQNLYELSGIPVCLFSGKSAPVLEIPSAPGTQEKTDCGHVTSVRLLCEHYPDYAEVCLRLMRLCEHENRIVHDVISSDDPDRSDLYLALFPIHRNDIVQGFLMIYTDDPASVSAFGNTCGLLPVFGEYISRHGMSDVIWKAYIERFHQFIYENTSSDLSIELVSSALHVSKTALYEQFHTYLGIPYARYIKKVRLEKACALLRDTDMSIMEISYAVGFNDYNYFCRTFKKEIGTPAGQYHKQHHAGREGPDLQDLQQQ